MERSPVSTIWNRRIQVTVEVFTLLTCSTSRNDGGKSKVYYGTTQNPGTTSWRVSLPQWYLSGVIPLLITSTPPSPRRLWGMIPLWITSTLSPEWEFLGRVISIDPRWGETLSMYVFWVGYSQHHNRCGSFRYPRPGGSRNSKVKDGITQVFYLVVQFLVIRGRNSKLQTG